METFTKAKDFVANPDYHRQRDKSLHALNLNEIDRPIIELIRGFTQLPHCFTLQCCYGHFVYAGQKNPHNLDPLPTTDNLTSIEYRIAYIAFCIQDSRQGRLLASDLSAITSIDPGYIQFGCADWFWEKQVNSYVLQVEPENQMFSDKAMVSYREASCIEKVRKRFFGELQDLMQLNRARLHT